MEGSKSNVELSYEVLGAYARGDEETLRARMDPEIEIDSVFGWLYEWHDGRSTRFHVYPTVEDALDAARDLAER
jgi:hypothetical protein